MKLRTSLGVFRASVLLALGLPATACSGDSTSDGAAGKVRPCTNSQPVSGKAHLEQCDEGFVHRTTPAQCQSQLPRPDACTPTVAGSESCSMDADCTEHPHGQCGIYGQLTECACQYGCVTDADCAAGQLCECGSPVGACVQATCRTDADCAGGALCVQTSLQKCGPWGYACQTPNDACTEDADCDPGQLCAMDGNSRKCLQNDCPVAGRPFFVEAEARVAAVEPREDWSRPLTDLALPVAEADRHALAAHWARVGQMEHASVAAFARFALQLLALGAPAELAIDTQQAMADEIRHAEACFGLASAYAQRALGPGTLNVDDALMPTDAAAIVRLTFREGCVGESAAAHEVREAAAQSEDPALRVMLEGIAADEERHALLAWRFVKWALVRFGAPVRAAVEAEVRGLQGEAEQRPGQDPLAAHGVLSEDTRLFLRQQAVRELVLPCAAALLADAGETVARV